MEKFPKVAIIYLSYHSEPYLEDVVESLKKISYPKNQVEFVIVDNPHPEFGLTNKYIEQYILPLSEKELPHITYLPQLQNKGFCGGNNIGIQWAIEHDFDYVYLHNQDGYMAADCVEKMVEVFENDRSIGSAQSTVLLYPEKNKINTTGNSFHYLGFGYIPNFGKNFEKKVSRVELVGYASGASLLMRIDLLKKFGLLDEELFAYHEDIEYSLRLKMMGYKIVCITDAVFFHKYVFNRNKSKFYYIERNRIALLLLLYKWKTLFLLLPPFIMMEIGLWIFFLKKGWVKERVHAYRYWFQKKHWSYWLKKRKYTQTNRVISDRIFLSYTTSTLFFGEKEDMNNKLLIYIANPLLKIYYVFLKIIIFW